MADNTTLNAGVGGDTIRTDEVGAVKVPVSKIMLGGDGLDLGFVSGSNPFPVIVMSGSQTGLLVGADPVAQSNPLPTRPMSGSQTGLLMGANPVAASNPLAITSISGSQIGILVGANPVAASNPFPVLHTSGSQTGLLMGANPVAESNPLAITSISGSQIGILVGANPAAQSNPLPTRSMSGSQTGLLVGADPVALSNRLPTYNMETSGQSISGSTARIVQYKNAQVASGSTQLIAPQGAGLKIRVLSAHVMNTTSVGAYFRWLSTGSAGVENNLSGYMPLAVSGGFVLPHNTHGWMQTAENEGLNAALNSASGGAGIILTWIVT